MKIGQLNQFFMMVMSINQISCLEEDHHHRIHDHHAHHPPPHQPHELLQHKVSQLLGNWNELYSLYFNSVHYHSKDLYNLLSDIQHDTSISHQHRHQHLQQEKKHILTILTDDQGWGDIGYNDPTFITPTLDFFANNGVKFDNFYVHSTCTPTRAALLTGLYASRTGLQDLPIIPGESRQLPLHFKTTGNIVKELIPETSTYFVGKWHLGNKHVAQLPLARGYDYYFGVLGGAVDHYNRTIGQRCGSADNNFSSIFANNCHYWNGYDLIENQTPYMDNTTFSSDLFGQKAADIIKSHDISKPMLLHLHFTAPHTPLQAPERYLDLCSNVSEGPKEAYQTYYRSVICGMVLSIDINILRVILTLYSRNMLSSTLILFHSDNGGYKQAGSLNTPYRSQKGTSFEGGVHVPAFLYGTALQIQPNANIHLKDLVHVSDVLPTLLGYLGTNNDIISSYKFDGMNHWENIMNRASLQRNEIHIDSTSSFMAYSSSYLRIIQNVTYKYHFNPSVITHLFVRQRITEQYEYEGEYFFNLSEDPSEMINLIPHIYQKTHSSSSQTTRRLELILELMRQEVLKSRENSHPTLLTGMPPLYDLPPSPLGCWLPLDSPLYHTFDCGIKPNFNLPKLPPSAKFLYTFESLPNITETETVPVSL